MRSRFIIAFTLIISGIGYWAYDEIASSMERRYREVVEELLVDQVQLVASGLSTSWKISSLDQAIQRSRTNQFEAKIYDLVKTSANLKAYVTDVQGKVIFHSESDSLVGADYSQWRDVFLTLKGEYGARSTRVDQSDKNTSVLWVSAPIYADGEIDGVLSLGKSVSDWSTLLNSAVWSVQKGTMGFIVLGIFSSLVMSLWIFNPLRKLQVFMDKGNFDKSSDGDEISRVASAFTSLQEDLQAKQYVENYVQILTHELKSPISAILGSTEILDSQPREDIRSKFTLNIESEAKRMQTLVETILKVSQLELENEIEKTEVSVSQLITQAEEALQHPLFESKVTLDIHYEKSKMSQPQDSLLSLIDLSDLRINVDQILIVQALVNLLINATQYSPENEVIDLNIALDIPLNQLVFSVRDHGPGIPEYALERLFDKFYSLKKPRTGKKGTGLGLSLVNEVARLHRGTIEVKNSLQDGVEATLRLPLSEGREILSS